MRVVPCMFSERGISPPCLVSEAWDFYMHELEAIAANFEP